MSLKESQLSPGRFRFRTKRRDNFIRLEPIKPRKRSGRKHSLEKGKIFLKTPDDLYHYQKDEPRDVTSSYDRNIYEPTGSVGVKSEGGRKIVHEKRMFTKYLNPEKKTFRKGMIIGERPSMWKAEPLRPELPGNLFVDNLRHQPIDWRKYDTVTWNDILGSHMKDVQNRWSNVQTLPQKEAWLASIDTRVRYSRLRPDRHLPNISPRLFNNRQAPPKPPQNTRYISRDKQGNVFYVVGPSDVTKKEHRAYVLPEISKTPTTPKKELDF
ncbi:hypothetical protein ACF0H5_007309 [Mactra antiquata]